MRTRRSQHISLVLVSSSLLLAACDDHSKVQTVPAAAAAPNAVPVELTDRDIAAANAATQPSTRPGGHSSAHGGMGIMPWLLPSRTSSNLVNPGTAQNTQAAQNQAGTVRGGFGSSAAAHSSSAAS